MQVFTLYIIFLFKEIVIFGDLEGLHVSEGEKNQVSFKALSKSASELTLTMM